MTKKKKTTFKADKSAKVSPFDPAVSYISQKSTPPAVAVLNGTKSRRIRLFCIATRLSI